MLISIDCELHGNMFGSDNYVDILHYGGYECLCWCVCRLEVVDDSIGRIIFVLVNYIMQVSMIDYMFGVASVLGSSRACRCEVGLFAAIDSTVAVEDAAVAVVDAAITVVDVTGAGFI